MSTPWGAIRTNLWRIVAIAVGVLLLGGIVVYFARPNEPSYQGRKLSWWLRRYAEVKYGVDLDFPNRRAIVQESEQAIHIIGTNAIPTLLAWLQSSDSRLKDRLNSLLTKQSFIFFQFQTAHDRQFMAKICFEMLGNDAALAVPALTNLLESPVEYRRELAFDCLAGIDHGTKLLLPTILKSLQSSNSDIQSAAAFYLRGAYPAEAEKAGVYKMFPILKRPTTNAASTNVPGRK